MSWLEKVLSAFAYSIAQESSRTEETPLGPPYNDVARFLVERVADMPDHLRGPIRLLTLGFDCAGLLHGGRLFHRSSHARRLRQIALWRDCRFAVFSELMRLYQSLSVFALYSRLEHLSDAR